MLFLFLSAHALADARRARAPVAVGRPFVPRQTWPTDSPRWHPDAALIRAKQSSAYRRLAWIMLLVTIVTFQFARVLICSKRERGFSDEAPLIDASPASGDGLLGWDQVTYPYGTRQRA
jgi:hypothetical protein